MPPSKTDIPLRLLRGNRQVDPIFSPDERLYRRCSKMMLYPDGRLYPCHTGSPQLIDFPDMSVNRSKYSIPTDVLLKNSPKYHNWGVVSIAVGDIPIRIDDKLAADLQKNQLDTGWNWKISHIPEDDNYAHSEIQSYLEMNYAANSSVPKLVRMWFRIKIADSMRIEIQPGA